jgi:hypothetical protein
MLKTTKNRFLFFSVSKIRVQPKKRSFLKVFSFQPCETVDCSMQSIANQIACVFGVAVKPRAYAATLLAHMLSSQANSLLIMLSIAISHRKT